MQFFLTKIEFLSQYLKNCRLRRCPPIFLLSPGVVESDILDGGVPDTAKISTDFEKSVWGGTGYPRHRLSRANGYRIPGTGYRIPGTGYRIPGTGYLLTGYRIPLKDRMIPLL